MAKAPTRNQRRLASTGPSAVKYNDHDLVAIDQRIPGKPPTDATIDIYEGVDYGTRFWHCRACGEERNRPEEFTDPCTRALLSNRFQESGYSMDEPRTRRAIAQRMSIEPFPSDPVYRVRRPSGARYRVDLAAETCTCLDHREREAYCKHLRRVDLEVRAGILPLPDGTTDR